MNGIGSTDRLQKQTRSGGKAETAEHVAPVDSGKLDLEDKELRGHVLRVGGRVGASGSHVAVLGLEVVVAEREEVVLIWIEAAVVVRRRQRRQQDEALDLGGEKRGVDGAARAVHAEPGQVGGVVDEARVGSEVDAAGELASGGDGARSAVVLGAGEVGGGGEVEDVDALVVDAAVVAAKAVAVAHEDADGLVAEVDEVVDVARLALGRGGHLERVFCDELDAVAWVGAALVRGDARERRDVPLKDAHVRSAVAAVLDQSRLQHAKELVAIPRHGHALETGVGAAARIGCCLGGEVVLAVDARQHSLGRRDVGDDASVGSHLVDARRVLLRDPEGAVGVGREAFSVEGESQRRLGRVGGAERSVGGAGSAQPTGPGCSGIQAGGVLAIGLVVEERVAVGDVEELARLAKGEIGRASVLGELEVKRVVTSDVVNRRLDVVAAVRLEVELARVGVSAARELAGHEAACRSDAADGLAILVAETRRVLADGDEALGAEVGGVDAAATLGDGRARG
ncbi:hypothetical protein L1887_62007 [Cichorium endivia]|nr:hypothetical protein L1887_62007 [Cichorium endivia]